MKTLTFDPYWAWALVYGSKRIENRTWQIDYRGPLAIHVGRDRSRDIESIEEITKIDPESLATSEQAEWIRGKIIAVCELSDIVKSGTESWEDVKDDPWSTGPYCWVFDNIRPLNKPIDAKGRLGIWNAEI